MAGDVVEGEFEAVSDSAGASSTNARAKEKAELLALMSRGQTLTQVCKALGFDPSTVWHWRQADNEFDTAYGQARKAMSDALADEALTIVRECATGEKPMAKEFVQAAHNYSQRAAWYASKMLPKLYGDAPAQVNIDNRTQVVVLSDEKRAELQDRLKRLQLESHGQTE